MLEKPRDEADARAMLFRLAGREHLVHTAVALEAPGGPGPRAALGTETTSVRFRPVGVETIAKYVATGEPLDKAGAYGIQGFGAALVESVRGCYFNVMGFPVTRVIALLEQLGWRYDFPGRLSRPSTCGDAAGRGNLVIPLTRRYYRHYSLVPKGPAHDSRDSTTLVEAVPR